MLLTTERENFVKVSYIILDIVANRLRVLFTTKWNEKHQMWRSDGRSGDQLCKNSGGGFKKSNKDYLEKMKSGNEKEWDITILCKIFLYSELKLIDKNTSEYTEIDKIRKIRNDCFAHPESMSCSDNDFKATVQKVKSAAKNLFGCDAESEISNIAKSSINKEMIENLVEPLKQEVGKDVAKVLEKQLSGNYLYRS